MRIAVVALVLVLTACGAQRAVDASGRGVLNDAYDGRLDRNWSCGSLRAADRRLPADPAAYSTIPKVIGDAAGKACDAALATLHDGDSRRQVATALGRPDRAPRCWLYRWPPGAAAGDGARICFSGGRVSTVQTAVHG